MLAAVLPPGQPRKGKILGGLSRPFLGGALEPVSWQGLRCAAGGAISSLVNVSEEQNPSSGVRDRFEV